MLLQAFLRNSPNLLESFKDSMTKYHDENPSDFIGLSAEEIRYELEGTDFIEEFLSDILQEECEKLVEGIQAVTAKLEEV